MFKFQRSTLEVTVRDGDPQYQAIRRRRISKAASPNCHVGI